MGRGLGPAQRGILNALDASDRDWLSVEDLGTCIDRSDRQVRTAVRALERRGLVGVTRQALAYHGVGEYGPVTTMWRGADWQPPDQYWFFVPKGGPWPDSPGYVTYRDMWFKRLGMPVNGLAVWGAEAWARKEEQSRAIRAAFAALSR